MLNTEQRKDAKYFIGTEIENTIMKGEATLFVVGVQPVADIVEKATKFNIKHIYLGTSQSFTPQTGAEGWGGWEIWDDMIRPLLDKGYWVTLDYDVKYAADIHEMGWHESNTFVPMISVKLPYIALNNYHTTVKIDDSTWGKTNPGVWSHRLVELMPPEKFTSWHEYTGDLDISE